MGRPHRVLMDGKSLGVCQLTTAASGACLPQGLRLPSDTICPGASEGRRALKMPRGEDIDSPRTRPSARLGELVRWSRSARHRTSEPYAWSSSHIQHSRPLRSTLPHRKSRPPAPATSTPLPLGLTGFVAPFDHDLLQRLAQHSTRTSCSPLSGCFTSLRYSAQADSTPTGVPRAPSPCRAMLLHSGCCLVRLSAKRGSLRTSLIFRPSGAPKYSVSTGFGLQDYYRIVRRQAELCYGAAILRPGSSAPLGSIQLTYLITTCIMWS
ncbi:hypothetical protein NDU88_002930 [Pleurodeles waltl]|uniref:Uncharacterized protein n=1 Tax=Pleurodeles waltl TaxID=8319 RepID=A0AAV7Q8I9_PLEWA|nr:hypothetical protein NDU88_002930 [Pleurodeles waltl]